MRSYLVVSCALALAAQSVSWAAESRSATVSSAAGADQAALAPIPLAPGLSKADELTTASPVNFLHDIAATNPDGTANLVVEIPTGTNEKWEVKPDGIMRWDIKDGKPRIVKYLSYVGNYGEIPQTRQEDGDPIDLMALTPAYPRGTVVRVRVIGAVKLTEKGETDDKLIGVVPGTPMGDIKSFAEMNEKFPGVFEIVKIWFEHYKGPDGGGMVFQGFADEKEAMAALEKTKAAYAEFRAAAK